MPKPKNPNEPENQPYILEALDDEELQDYHDELEENVGVPPRKVTEQDVEQAEAAFDQLMASEEEVFETSPFRPGKDTQFVLTDYQQSCLQDGISELEKYFKYEDRHQDLTAEDNKRLRVLLGAMKKIKDKGLDALNPEEKEAVSEYNDIMDAEYTKETDNYKTMIRHIDNCNGPYRIKMSNLHRGLDMLGVLTGKPARYEYNTAESQLSGRTNAREKTLKDKIRDQKQEVNKMLDTAKKAGLAELQKKFSGTDIGRELGHVSSIMQKISNWNEGVYTVGDDLKAADSLGGFLNKRNTDGKTNYDRIAEKILGKNPKDKEKAQKRAFDELLSQLNTVCDLDVNVPFAIEVQKEYEWNKNQQRIPDAIRIDGLNEKIFGERKVQAQDKDFLESVGYLAQKIRETNKNGPLDDVNRTKFRNALLGFEKFKKVVEGNSPQNKVPTDSENIIAMLDIGKTLKIKDGGKTLYEWLAEEYKREDPDGQAKLDATLEELNTRLDLKIAIPGKAIEGKAAAQEQQPEKPEQHEIYTKEIEEVQRSSNRMDNPQHLKLALASVLALRRMSVDPAHNGHTRVRTKAALAKAKALMETKAFNELTKDMDVETLAKKIHHPGNFDKEFTQKIKDIDQAEYEGRLKDTAYKNRLTACARKAAREMNKTGTGKYYMIGIKRGKNSGMYDRAILGMEQAAKNPDGATTMKSVQAVKEYLSNKMTRRKSPSGKQRWQNCMDFLSEAMPPEEFKEYCNEVNKARKVTEGSPHYVSPEMFGTKKQQVQRLSSPAELGKPVDRSKLKGNPEEPEKDQEEITEEAGSSRLTI